MTPHQSRHRVQLQAALHAILNELEESAARAKQSQRRGTGKPEPSAAGGSTPTRDVDTIEAAVWGSTLAMVGGAAAATGNTVAPFDLTAVRGDDDDEETAAGPGVTRWEAGGSSLQRPAQHQPLRNSSGHGGAPNPPASHGPRGQRSPRPPRMLAAAASPRRGFAPITGSPSAGGFRRTKWYYAESGGLRTSASLAAAPPTRGKAPPASPIAKARHKAPVRRSRSDERRREASGARPEDADPPTRWTATGSSGGAADTDVDAHATSSRQPWRQSRKRHRQRSSSGGLLPSIDVPPPVPTPLRAGSGSAGFSVNVSSASAAPAQRGAPQSASEQLRAAMAPQRHYGYRGASPGRQGSSRELPSSAPATMLPGVSMARDAVGSFHSPQSYYAALRKGRGSKSEARRPAQSVLR